MQGDHTMTLSVAKGHHICGGNLPNKSAPSGGISVPSGEGWYSGPTPGPKGKGSTAQHRGNNGMIGTNNAKADKHPFSLTSRATPQKV